MSLANIKRKLSLGAKVQMIQHDWYPQSVQEDGKLYGVREVDLVQSNAVRFSNGSWLYWPKAGEVRETENGFEVALTPDFLSKMVYEWR